MSTSIQRAGPPRAVQKVRDGHYTIQVLLTEPPSADWKRLFYDAQQNVPEDFPPRAIDISGTVLRFRSDAASVASRIALIDRWIERANQKEGSLGLRSEEDRRRREAAAAEQQELAALNERWRNL